MTEVGGQQDVGFLYSYDPATNTLDSLIDFSTINYTTFPFDSLRDDSYAHSNGWEFMLASDNKLYGLTIGSMFSYDPATKEFKSLNKLSVGGGITGHPEINKLGIYTFYAHLLEICTPPYYRNTISDTLYFIVGQPATFTISTPNTDTFHWTKNNTAIALADSTLSFTSIALADSGTYQCLLKNECGDSLLKSFYVKVGQILPIGFALTGKVQNNNAVLQWQDLAANNVNYYELQRSADGRNFAPLTKVSATNQTAYRYTDVGAFASPSPSERDGVRFFYRLKQTGKDGKENLSNIVELNTESSTLNFALSPNPAKDKLTVAHCFCQ